MPTANFDLGEPTFWVYENLLEYGRNIFVVEQRGMPFEIVKARYLEIMKKRDIETFQDFDISAEDTLNAVKALIQYGWKLEYIPIGP